MRLSRFLRVYVCVCVCVCVCFCELDDSENCRRILVRFSFSVAHRQKLSDYLQGDKEKQK